MLILSYVCVIKEISIKLYLYRFFADSGLHKQKLEKPFLILPLRIGNNVYVTYIHISICDSSSTFGSWVIVVVLDEQTD